jgi:hypothetical protein
LRWSVSRLDECMIAESASCRPLLNLFHCNRCHKSSVKLCRQLRGVGEQQRVLCHSNSSRCRKICSRSS